MSDQNRDSFEDVNSRVETFKEQIREFDDLLKTDVADPPGFDLTASYRNFAEGLVSGPNERQRPELEDFVQGQVDSELHGWVDKINNLSSVQEQVYRFSRRVEEEIRGLTADINSHSTRESEAKEEIARLQSEIVESEQQLEQVRNPSRFDNATLWIVIAGVTLLALGGAYYYLETRGQVIVAQNGGPQNYFDSGAERFSVGAFLKQTPLNLFHAFPAIIFFLLGKFAAMIYGHFGNPRGLFLASFVLTFGVAIGTAVLISFGAATSFELATVEAKYNAALGKIDDLSFIIGASVDCKSANYAADPACIALTEAEDSLAVARVNSGSLTLWVTLSVLLSEIMVGSTAWMFVEDYRRKHHENGGNLTVQIAKMNNRLGSTKTKRDEIGRQVGNLKEAKQKLGLFQGKIAHILTRVPVRDAIERKRSHILNREQQLAWAQLLEVRRNWPHHRAAPEARSET